MWSSRDSGGDQKVDREDDEHADSGQWAEHALGRRDREESRPKPLDPRGP
ncbi:hypothetical protein [Nocardiopsis rhodophaea]